MNKYSSLIENIDNFYIIATKKTEIRTFGPYLNRATNRKIIIEVAPDGTRKTTSYPKWLLSKHLGYDLKDMTVDHLDRDKTNDDINNLRAIPRADHSALDTRRVVLIKLKCSLCNKKFERSPRLIRDKAKKGVRGQFCSRQCAGAYSRKLQLGQIKKFPKQKHIDSTYYRNKKEADLKIDRLIEKYS